MTKKRSMTVLFLVAALYDGLLGAAFLLASDPIFKWLDVEPPNHLGYVQFPAALLVIFAVMFLAIAMRPVRNRNLIPYCILLKLSYCSVVMYHWYTAGIPDMWKPIWVADFTFLILFIWAWITLGKKERL